MSDQNTSTLQSTYEKVTGAAQSALGSLTGSTADKAQGEQKKNVADARHEASRAGTTVGGYSLSTSGVAANNPHRQEGSWNQTLGAGKEFVGGALGFEGLKNEGQQQNARGKEQEAAGQLSDLGAGIGNRVAGSVGGAVAGLTGDRDELARREAQHDQGKTLQRGVESEVRERAEAEGRE